MDNKEKVSFENEINLKEIHYQIDDKVILDNINYKFEKNKAYAIVGTSGSGKTTLMNILSGKIQSYNGTVLYDELNTKNCSIDSLFEIKFLSSILAEFSVFKEVEYFCLVSSNLRSKSFCFCTKSAASFS